MKAYSSSIPLKHSSFIVVTAIVTLSGCIEARPVPLDARPGIISGISRQNLKAALVNQNVNSIRMVYRAIAAGDALKPQEQLLDETNMPITREIAKASTDVFVQVFDQVVSLRQLPTPGEYDVVVVPKLEVMHMMAAVAASYLKIEYSFGWSIMVLNRDGVQVMSKKGTSQVIRIEHRSSMPDTVSLNNEIGSKMSALIASIASEWGTIVASSPEVQALALSEKEMSAVRIL